VEVNRTYVDEKWAIGVAVAHSSTG